MMNRGKFLQYNQERNENVGERYELAIGRMVQITEDSIIEEPYRTYFVRMSELFLKLDRLWNAIQDNTESISNPFTLEEQKQWNELLCSSDWAVKHFQEDNPYKKVLSVLCSEITRKISDVYRGRLDLLTIDAELFLEIYSIFQDEPNVRQIEQAIYWHNSDYADIFEEDLVERILGIAPSYEKEVIWNEKQDKFCEEGLYQYGYKVAERHLKTAQTYHQFSLEERERLVDFVMEQYFSYQNSDNLQGKIVPMCFDMGLEFIAKRIIERLEEKHIYVAVCKMEDLCLELLYDREDETDRYFWMNRQYKERRLQVLHTQLERWKEKTNQCLSPLVLYSRDMKTNDNHNVSEIEEGHQSGRQKKMWKEYFEQQENMLYSYIPYKTCIVL